MRALVMTLSCYCALEIVCVIIIKQAILAKCVNISKTAGDTFNVTIYD